ncbi:hypothetical protein Ldro_1258 [Legionella drozanskii LLAP-1]|uniref:Uncharacterized protein n=1 Tax=Legionella drozanskii LLAP-1 TaxID=1212489 RepID=A0A0W0SW90_9GAMM|nr:hypothetical protein Ldro_1258 [Legionella drozanskii LLAP-1]
MTKHNLSKLLYSFKSFLNHSKRKQVYLKTLEADYIRLSSELNQIKQLLIHI